MDSLKLSIRICKMDKMEESLNSNRFSSPKLNIRGVSLEMVRWVQEALAKWETITSTYPWMDCLTTRWKALPPFQISLEALHWKMVSTSRVPSDSSAMKMQALRDRAVATVVTITRECQVSRKASKVASVTLQATQASGPTAPSGKCTRGCHSTSQPTTSSFQGVTIKLGSLEAVQMDPCRQWEDRSWCS